MISRYRSQRISHAVLVLLFQLSHADAIVRTEKSVVLDYLDIAPGMRYDGTCNTTCTMYATGYDIDEEHLRNVHIKIGTAAEKNLTLAGIAMQSPTGEKISIAIPETENYTITNENPTDSVTLPFYIFITTETSPLKVLDAYPLTRVRANKTVLIMSPAALLTLHSFDAGTAEAIDVSPAAPDSSSILMSVTRSAPPMMSIAKIFSPIISVKPRQPGADFSFSVDISQDFDLHFDRGALFAFSSPGNAGQTGGGYAHVLTGRSFDCIFSTNGGSDIWTNITVTYSNVANASIIYRQTNGYEPLKIGFGTGGGIGHAKTGQFAKDILLHWDGGQNNRFAVLEAVFSADTTVLATTSSVHIETATATTSTSDATTRSLLMSACILITWQHSIDYASK